MDKWIKENIPYDKNILCQWYYRESINFFTECKYNIGKIEKIRVASDTINEILSEEIGKPLFIWLRRDSKKIVGNCFFVQSENDLLQQINAQRSDYIIVTFRRNFLSLYFENNPNFTFLKSFSNGEIKIYKVKDFPVIPSIDFSTKFEGQTYMYLRRLYQKAPYKYEEEKQNLKKILRWSDDEFSAFLSFVERGDEKGFWEHYERIEERKIY